MKTESVALTDRGKLRKVNEDYVYATDKSIGSLKNLYILADGMGGYKAGDFASMTTVNTVKEAINNSQSESAPIKIFKKAIEKANSKVHELSQKDEYRNMGSTLVMATVDENMLTVANIGDSRLYLVRDGITQVTKDHSLVEEEVRDGRLLRGSAEYRQKKAIITRAIGTFPVIRPDYFEVELSEGDEFILCSDGLSNMLSDDEILNVLSDHGSLSYKARTLIDKANGAGGEDNIAVILVKYTKDGELDA